VQACASLSGFDGVAVILWPRRKLAMQMGSA
jgi:hypothetical protein